MSARFDRNRSFVNTELPDFVSADGFLIFKCATSKLTELPNDLSILDIVRSVSYVVSNLLP